MLELIEHARQGVHVSPWNSCTEKIIAPSVNTIHSTAEKHQRPYCPKHTLSKTPSQHVHQQVGGSGMCGPCASKKLRCAGEAMNALESKPST
mmetsp:Transcript_65279/g.173097  ORF Transcript_65279/g.173097 Transcript_65279/m.173097 type:complete len:92 (+) Transcript_65279:1656-1931(+)